VLSAFTSRRAPQVDAGIKGITPGAETQQFLARKAFAARLVGCLALGGLAVSAELADRACGALLGAPVGCMNFLLLAGLLTSMERQARPPARLRVCAWRKSACWQPPCRVQHRAEPAARCLAAPGRLGTLCPMRKRDTAHCRRRAAGRPNACCPGLLPSPRPAAPL